MHPESKLPDVTTTIFTVMSQLANECGAINLSQGFPSFDPPEALTDKLVYAAMGFEDADAFYAQDVVEHVADAGAVHSL